MFETSEIWLGEPVGFITATHVPPPPPKEQRVPRPLTAEERERLCGGDASPEKLAELESQFAKPERKPKPPKKPKESRWSRD